MNNDAFKGEELEELERLRDEVRNLEAERSELYLRLERAGMIDAIATTAQGIAHDMNNILGSIMGLASVLKFDIEPSSQMEEDVEAIEATCLQGRDLMQRLMALARQRPRREAPLELNRIVSSLEPRLREALPGHAELHLDLSREQLKITGDVDQLEHAIACLCRNACESLEPPGRIAVTTSPIILDAKDLRGSPWLSSGPYARLGLSDSGDGMDPQTLGLACKPFFTTREGHDGLGLTLVYWVTKNHGGRLIIESDPGEGTTVTVDLPTSP